MSGKPRAMRDAFLESLLQAMDHDSSIFFASGDFGSPVLDRIRDLHPDRFVNVGIAEQNLINVSAGLALEGYKVFAYAIAPFITMRCYEQIRVNLALLSEVRPMNVNLIGVGAGYSYVVSGPTHQCYEDLTIMRALPNMAILSPADHVTAASFCGYCLQASGPKYLRFDAQVLPTVYDVAPDLKRGFHVHRDAGSACLIATGYMLHTALKVADNLAQQGKPVSVIDLFDITGFEGDSLAATIERYAGIVTLEEGFRARGGVDAMMFDFTARRGLGAKMLNVGVEGGYRFELGTRAELHEHASIGVEAATQRIAAFMNVIGSEA